MALHPNNTDFAGPPPRGVRIPDFDPPEGVRTKKMNKLIVLAYSPLPHDHIFVHFAHFEKCRSVIFGSKSLILAKNAKNLCFVEKWTLPLKAWSIYTKLTGPPGDPLRGVHRPDFDPRRGVILAKMCVNGSDTHIGCPPRTFLCNLHM